jgi:hypothetical protein
MNIQDFADMTIGVIRDDGIADYLPTFVFLDTREVRAISGIPFEVDHRDAIQNVMRQSGYDKRECFFGVKSAPQQITIGHFRPGQPTAFMEIIETPEGYSASQLSSCDWWRVL